MVPVRSLAAFLLAGSTLAAQTTIHVPADVPTIQGAIALAQDGDTVLVAPGTYDEELDYLGKAITLRSEAGAASTILTNVNAIVSFTSGEGPGSVLRGFTVTGNDSSRSAIHCPGATPLVQQCVIRGNRTSAAPAAGIWGDATIEDCVIEDNVNGNGTAGVWGAATLRRCVLRGNAGYDAAAVHLTGGGLADCRITGNSSAEGSGGGAVAIESATAVSLARCLVAGNTKDTWGGTYSARGAGVTVSHSSAPAALVNCTIAGNHVTTPGVYGPDYGGLHGPATLVNCIVRDNDGLQLDSTTLSATYCDIEGGLAGTGNFDLDPLFRDAPNGDYRLRAGSPCIDTGDPSAPLDPDGSRVEVGAETFVRASATVLLGSGANPILLTSVTPPAIGTSWQVAIQAGLVAGTTTSGLQARASVRVPPMTTPYGEILISGLRLITVVAPSNGVQDLFSFAFPNDLALVGILFYAQGFVAHPGALRLGNGLTVWIGE